MDIRDYIRSVYDFPVKGVHFRDVTPLLENPLIFRHTIDLLVEKTKVFGKIDKIAAPEARGFIFCTPLALALNAGFVPIRKPGKLPYQTISESFSLEYGTDMLQMHVDAVKPGERVLLFDDLLATGGTMQACKNLVEKCGGEIAGIAFVLELLSFEGRKKLNLMNNGPNVVSLVQYE